MQKVYCVSDTSEIADTIGLCSTHTIVLFSVIIIDNLSLRDFCTLVFLYTVSIAGGSDKLEGTKGINSDIVRFITCDTHHVDNLV